MKEEISYKQQALDLHAKYNGKLEVACKVKLDNASDLALAYTPGVAEACKEIANDSSLAYKYTCKSNMVAVVSDGTAVLGLGDIGPLAAIPVMEGKSVLFKKFANVDAVPICLATKDTEEIIKTVELLAPSFAGINLEDIAAPRCFEIEKRLKEKLNIPVFHDDQHGTAIVTLAAIINALKIVNKKLDSVRFVINGAGAAGIAIAKLLMTAGAKDIILCNRKGILETSDDNDEVRNEMSILTNPQRLKGSLSTALKGADVFIGVSGPRCVSKEDISLMSKDAIVLAMANPIPEIYPDEAKSAGARIVGTGRSDFPNQVNNVLVFPAIFRAALDLRTSDISDRMKLICAYAIAEAVKEECLNEEHILPSIFEENLSFKIAETIVNRINCTDLK